MSIQSIGYATRNPAFNNPAFAPADWRGIAADQMSARGQGEAQARRDAGYMTLSGTMAKTSFLLGLCMLSATAVYAGLEGKSIAPAMGQLMLIGGAIGGLVLALIIGFKPKAAPFLAWFYALVEGVVLGAISWFIADRLGAKADGLVFQAVTLTLGIAVGAVAVTWTGLLRLSGTMIRVISFATMGVMLAYLASFVLSLVGMGDVMSSIHSSGPIGIGFSLVVVGIASFRLVADLQMVQDAANSQSPKYMEWYSGFALLVTLVWLYVEVLRLLAKLRGRE